ncbi:class I SAM-dependent methyltransferase [Euzebyella marina]|nr:class I SAM-dependent methyltransferase [Euzebyella marina]
MENKKDKKDKKPWPTKDVMAQIYEKNLWGGIGHAFFSGEGSHEQSLVMPWLKAVQEFLGSFKNPISVCDLGCGDFNVGKELLPFCSHYIGVDIVHELIDHNKSQFPRSNLEFRCLDIAQEILPSADCAILRQVLQHLSNEEILKVLEKLHQYQYVILTEHLPEGDFIPNKNIISGQGIRLKKQSGVNVEAPPFNLKVKSQERLLEVFPKDGKGRIVTILYEF